MVEKEIDAKSFNLLLMVEKEINAFPKLAKFLYI